MIKGVKFKKVVENAFINMYNGYELNITCVLLVMQA